MPTKKVKKKKNWKCVTCKKQKTDKDPGIECEICNEWAGLECTNYKEEVIEYLSTNEVEVTFICISCKETLPELRNLLEIRKQQQELKKDIENHDTRITTCEVNLENITQKQETNNELLLQINNRLSDVEAKMINKDGVETIAQKLFKDADFPPLKEVKQNQEQTQKQLEQNIQTQREEKEEEKRRGEKEKSLIVFGVPETCEDKAEQMKEDFNTIQKLYTTKAELSKEDLLQITRLGTKKEKQVRPIKMTFTSMQKRAEILRNNKNLILEGENLSECTSDFCNDKGMNHQHIYITTDKTKQQIEEEKKLRTELKIKRETDPNLIIRNGKIITKSTNHARWSEIIKNET